MVSKHHRAPTVVSLLHGIRRFSFAWTRMSMWEVGFIQMEQSCRDGKGVAWPVDGEVQHTQIKPSGDTNMLARGTENHREDQKGGFEMLKHERCQSGHAKMGEGPYLSPAKRCPVP